MIPISAVPTLKKGNFGPISMSVGPIGSIQKGIEPEPLRLFFFPGHCARRDYGDGRRRLRQRWRSSSNNERTSYRLFSENCNASSPFSTSDDDAPSSPGMMDPKPPP
ncbi:hypothetical protein MRB53_009238 [Persea americana]|uniref:Uncharacterized protein n=1 Tax=Persea americana TaxID=3435 RepID=A0ACC2LPM5_PERAE|nr:hypothetical protein MRB53_009238 [Persea americana]